MTLGNCISHGEVARNFSMRSIAKRNVARESVSLRCAKLNTVLRAKLLKWKVMPMCSIIFWHFFDKSSVLNLKMDDWLLWVSFLSVISYPYFSLFLTFHISRALFRSRNFLSEFHALCFARETLAWNTVLRAKRLKWKRGARGARGAKILTHNPFNPLRQSTPFPQSPSGQPQWIAPYKAFCRGNPCACPELGLPYMIIVHG